MVKSEGNTLDMIYHYHKQWLIDQYLSQPASARDWRVEVEGEGGKFDVGFDIHDYLDGLSCRTFGTPKGTKDVDTLSFIEELEGWTMDLDDAIDRARKWFPILGYRDIIIITPMVTFELSDPFKRKKYKDRFWEDAVCADLFFKDIEFNIGVHPDGAILMGDSFKQWSDWYFSLNTKQLKELSIMGNEKF